MTDDTAPDTRIGALIAHRGGAAGLAVETRAIGSAILVTCDAHPLDVAFNRAFEVDAREPGVVAALVAHARRTGRRAMLEINLDSLGDAQKGELGSLGLVKKWDMVVLRRDLGAPVPDVPSGVTVREVRAEEADAFAALTMRAYGPPPAGFPALDDALQTRKWAALARLGRARCFFAELDGVPCAIGVFTRLGATALVDGAATLADRRGRGCQSALLAHRFREARAEGARVAITRTAAAASQRNLERAGMAVYRRTEMWGDP
jgi:GNAT superfamily N-acetyltransferase